MQCNCLKYNYLIFRTPLYLLSIKICISYEIKRHTFNFIVYCSMNNTYFY